MTYCTANSGTKGSVKIEVLSLERYLPGCWNLHYVNHSFFLFFFGGGGGGGGGSVNGVLEDFFSY